MENNATDNEVLENELVQAKCTYFHLKVQVIDESLLNKIENLDKDNKL